MAGQRFGRFTVICREQSSERYPAKNGAYWKVRCDCGAERVALGSPLRKGRYSSCGCAKGATPESLVGVRHGRLTVIRDNPKETGKRLTSQVKCDCGVEKSVTRDEFKAGRIKSCGCLKIVHIKRMQALARVAISKKPKVKKVNPDKKPRERKPRIDLSGHRFGILTVKSLLRYENGDFLWHCVCDCGGEKEVKSNLLSGNKTCSCGCARKKRMVVRPEHARIKQSEYQINRRKTNSTFALNKRMRDMVRKSLINVGSKKTARWKDIIGYTPIELENHLRNTIPEGFTWAHFLSGDLHIDHVIPLSVFNFERETDADFRRAWSLGNLQLLPSEVNILKSNNLINPFQPSLAM
jgi:hypothetical protein